MFCFSSLNPVSSAISASSRLPIKAARRTLSRVTFLPSSTPPASSQVKQLQATTRCLAAARLSSFSLPSSSSASLKLLQLWSLGQFPCCDCVPIVLKSGSVSRITIVLDKPSEVMKVLDTLATAIIEAQAEAIFA